MHYRKVLLGIFAVAVGINGFTPQAIAQASKEHSVVASSRAKIGSTALSVGQQLSGDDRITVLSGGRVVVICRNLTEAIFTTSAKVSSKCPSTQRQATDDRSLMGVVWDWFRGKPLPSSVVETRGGLADIPYVISPRKSKILTTRPRIRWNLVEGAESYTVQLSSPATDTISWEKTAAELNFQYPLAESALVPGKQYQVKITADSVTASTEVDSEKSVWIEVLDIAEQQEFFGFLEELRQEDLSPQTEIILESILYEEFEFYSQAITILSGYVRENANAVEVRERLAELYGRVGLLREEYREYQQIEVLTRGEVTEIRTRALNRLADFAEADKEEAIAAAYRAESQKISRQLGLELPLSGGD